MGATESREQPVATEAFEEYLPQPASLSLVESLFPEDPTEIIYLSGSGFSMTELSLLEDDIIEFQWLSLSEPGYSVYQAVSDGSHLKPVPGGFTSGPPQMSGKWRQRLRHAATYWFIATGVRTSPMSITVLPRDTTKVLVNETGFHPETLSICKGRKVQWHWKDPLIQHSVHQVEHCARHNGFTRTDVGSKLATLTGSFTHQFLESGLYYFQTGGTDQDGSQLCVVHVLDIPNEHTVQVLAKSFSPMLLTIEQFDRVWWHWDSAGTDAVHAVFQVHCPELEESAEEPLRAVDDGFKWSTPSVTGLVSHVFDIPGIFFCADQSYEAVASYASVIVVLPAAKKHYFELTKEQGIRPNLVCIERADRLWWVWNPHEISMKQQSFVMEIERCIGGGEGTTMTYNHCRNRCSLLTEQEREVIESVGLQVTTPTETGVYQYRLSNCGVEQECCSVVVVPGSNNVFVTVADDGYNPRIISVMKGDTVWWTWHDTQAAHNIFQVDQTGERIAGGFCSGGMLESPAAACHRFDKAGIFYYCSQSLPILYGVVQVYSQPIIAPIYVSEISLEPTLTRVGDVVAWVFQKPTCFDVINFDVLSEEEHVCNSQDHECICPRRVIARQMATVSVRHYSSPHFGVNVTKEPHQLQNSEGKVCSLIVDDVHDATTIHVSNCGFIPARFTVYKDASVCWSWKDAAQLHNIVRVKSPLSDTPLEAITGVDGFSSGDVVADSQFVFTFSMAGEYWVASEGAPGHTCCIVVLGHPLICEKPYISSKNVGGVVGFGEVVTLQAVNEEDSVYFTIDGSFPEFGNASCQKYNTKLGIRLEEHGFTFVRAFCFNERCINSAEMTSPRFEVQRKLIEPTPERLVGSPAAVAGEDEKRAQLTALDWLKCLPRMECYFSVPGTLVVKWSEPLHLHLVSGFQVFINSITYCPMISNSSCSATCSGLAGGQTYTVRVSVFSCQPQCFPLESNSATVVCPDVTLKGGPLISLRLSMQKDCVTCVWQHLQADAMSYLVCLNGIPIGDPVMPSKGSRECHTTIEQLCLNTLYKLFVTPVSMSGKAMVSSNKIAFRLPLSTQNIRYPETHRAVTLSKQQLAEFIWVVSEEEYKGAGQTFQQKKISDYIEKYRIHQQLVTSSAVKRISIASSRKPQRCKFSSSSDAPSSDSEGDVSKRRRHMARKDAIYRRDAGAARAQTYQQFYTTTNQQAQFHQNQHGPMDRGNARNMEAMSELKALSAHPEQELNFNFRGPNAGFPTASERSGSTNITLDSRDSYLNYGAFEERTVYSGSYPDFVSEGHLSITRGQHHPESVQWIAEEIPNDYHADPSIYIQVENGFHGETTVHWHVKNNPGERIQKEAFILHVAGTSFNKADASPNLSFETKVTRRGTLLDGVEYCYHLEKSRSTFVLDNLLPSSTYDFYLTLICRNESDETEHRKSRKVQFTTWGASQPPVLRCVAIGEREVTLSWEPREVNGEIHVTSFVLHVKPQGFTKSFSASDRDAVLSNLYPGVEYRVSCVAVTDRVDVEDSEPSNEIVIFSPSVPQAPEYVSVSPAVEAGKVAVYWPTGRTGTQEYAVLSYIVFLDGEVYDEVPVDSSLTFCSCDIDDLEPTEVYEVAVIARVGWAEISPFAVVRRVVCQVLSDFSVIVPIMCSAPPLSYEPELVDMNELELRVCWQPALEFRDATVSGYQVLLDGSPYGDIISCDQLEVCLQGLTYKCEYAIAVKALTQHAVGHVPGGGLYSACEPGPALVVRYAGFTVPPTNVFDKQRTATSLSVGWQLSTICSSSASAPDCLMIILDKTDTEREEVRTVCLSAEMSEITFDGLSEATGYRIVVQSRKLLHFSKGDTVLYANSGPLCVRTLSPPKGPKNLAVTDVATTSLKLAWTNQPDPFNQIERLRVEYAPNTNGSVLPLTRELPANAETITLRNLFEGTEYHISLIAVTAEYRNSTLLQRSTATQRTVVPKSPWTPILRTLAVTSGSDAAKNIRVIDRTYDSVHISWTPATALGENQVTCHILRWVEWSLVGATSKSQFSHKEQVGAESESFDIRNLRAGISYRITVDAFIRTKMHLDEDKIPSGPYADLIVSSEPFIARTLPRLEPFHLGLPEINENEVSLQWTTPVLWSSTTASESDCDTKYQLWELVDYSVRCDCQVVKQLGQCTSCVLDRNVVTGDSLSVWANLRQIFPERMVTEEIIESVSSNNANVVFPGEGQYSELSVAVEKTPGHESHAAQLSWTIPRELGRISHQVVRLFYTDGWSVIATRDIRVKAEGRGAVISLDKNRCLAVFRITAVRSGEANLVSTDVSAIIPGPLQHPKVWLYRQAIKTFTICWGEQQTFTALVAGYSVSVNGRDLQPPVDSEKRWLEIPCTPDATYTVQVRALSGDTHYESSSLSAELQIFSGSVVDTFFASAAISPSAKESFIPLTASENLGKSIALSWPKLPPAVRRELLEYRMVWSTATDPQKREVPLKVSRTKYRLSKLMPGETYYFKLYLFSREHRIIHQSREIDIVVSAPPDAPVVRLKSSNLKSVCVQWDKCKEYGTNHVAGYTVLIDSAVTANVPPTSREYIATNGKACQQYVFQVGAQGVTSAYGQALSEPLIVTWPGLVPPQLRHIPTNKVSEIQVSWTRPSITGGLQIAAYRVHCVEDAEPLLQGVYKTVLGPLHHSTMDAHFKGLPHTISGFQVYLEIECHGVAETFRSDPIKILPGVAPPAPILTVDTLGASRRSSLDQAIVRLCQRRDRLLQSIHIEAHECKLGMCDLSTNFEMYQLADTLYRIEQLLSEALKQVEEYTGSIELGLSWHVEEAGVPVARYRLFVDGAQYGADIGNDIRNTTISLGLEKDQHSIMIKSVREKPEIMSGPSNTVTVTGESFHAFTHFCLHHVHMPNKRFPDYGCCSYQQTFNQEIHTNSGTALCPGPLHAQRFFPSLSATLAIDGSSIPIVSLGFDSYALSAVHGVPSNRSSKRRAKLILVWTPWCKASQRAIKTLMVCAEKGKADVTYITCAFDPTTDGPIDWQLLSQQLSEMQLTKCSSVVHTVVTKDACEALAIFGVPTFILVHPNHTMAFQGRIPIARTADLENTIIHLVSRIKRIPCQSQDCFMCEPLLTALAAVNVDSQNQNQGTPGFFPPICRPLEVSPAYPPLNVNPFIYDPFLARWRQYNPYRQLPSRRVPWAFYSGDFPNQPGAGAESKKRRDDFKELPPIQRSPISSEQSRASSNTRCTSGSARVPWFRPRKSVLMRHRSPVRSLNSSQRTSADSAGGSAPSASSTSLLFADSPFPGAVAEHN